MPLEQEHQENKDGKYQVPIPIIFRVTSAGLAPGTRRNYEKDINHFLDHFEIKDIEPLKEYSLQPCKQMIIDYVIHLRETKKLSRRKSNHLTMEEEMNSPMMRNNNNLEGIAVLALK